MSGQFEGWDPLHIACQDGNLQALTSLLHARAYENVNVATPIGDTPLHIASFMGFTPIVKMLIENGAAVEIGNTAGLKPLHSAAMRGHCENLELLLREGADVNAKTLQGDTALHLACSHGHLESVLCLLEHKALKDLEDAAGWTPLTKACVGGHKKIAELLIDEGAAINNKQPGFTCLHGACSEGYSEIVQFLIQEGADINAKDTLGDSPLHKAAKRGCSICVKLLIKANANVCSLNNDDVSALHQAIKETPNVFKELFNEGIDLVHEDQGKHGATKICLQFKNLLLNPSYQEIHHSNETRLLMELIECGQEELVRHPLCQSYLYFKWIKIRAYFNLYILSYILFVAALTTYTISAQYDKQTGETKLVSRWVLVLFVSVLLVKELCQLYRSLPPLARHKGNIFSKRGIFYNTPKYPPFREYFLYSGWRNLIQWAVLLTTVAAVFHEHVGHDVAAIALLLAWSELVLMLGKFPPLGIYIEMFKSVFVNFTKVLLAYACLIIAFALSFSILFANRPHFDNPWESLMSTLVMMSGEYGYNGDLFHNPDNPLEYPLTAHLVFLAFVLLLSIVMMNLLVGLAVSDIQDLRQRALLARLVRQTRLLADIDSIAKGRFFNIVPKMVRNQFFKQTRHPATGSIDTPDRGVYLHIPMPVDGEEGHAFSPGGNGEKWGYYISPAKSSSQLPPDIMEAVYKLAKDKASAEERRRSQCQTPFPLPHEVENGRMDQLELKVTHLEQLIKEEIHSRHSIQELLKQLNTQMEMLLEKD